MKEDAAFEQKFANLRQLVVVPRKLSSRIIRFAKKYFKRKTLA